MELQKDPAQQLLTHARPARAGAGRNRLEERTGGRRGSEARQGRLGGPGKLERPAFPTLTPLPLERGQPPSTQPLPPVRILCLPCPGGPPMTAGGYGGTPATLLPTLPGRGAVSQEGFSHHRSSELLPSLQLPGQALLGPPALPRPRGWSSSFRSSASEGVSSGSLNTHTSQNIFSSQPSSPCLPSGPAALDSHGCRDFSRQQSP